MKQDTAQQPGADIAVNDDVESGIEIEGEAGEEVIAEGDVRDQNISETPTEEIVAETLDLHEVLLEIEHPSFSYASTSMQVIVGISCTQGCAQVDGTLSICNKQGDTLASALLNESEEVQRVTMEVLVPDDPGEYSYSVVFDGSENELHQSGEVSFSFEVKEHSVLLSAWGVPTPVNKGETFVVNIGARCPGNCVLAGVPVAVYDEKGAQIAQAPLGSEVREKTSGTYTVALELPAPEHEDFFTWVIKCDCSQLDISHRTKDITMSFRTLAAPEHTITLNVIEARDQLPIEMANVMCGHHRTFTDAQGCATLAVPSGIQTLRVSKQDFRLHQEEIDIQGDRDIALELVYDPCL